MTFLSSIFIHKDTKLKMSNLVGVYFLHTLIFIDKYLYLGREIKHLGVVVEEPFIVQDLVSLCIVYLYG